MDDLSQSLSAHLSVDGAPKVIERRFVVEEELAGMRLDQYLHRKIPRLSRTRVQEVIRTQLTFVPARSLVGPRPVKPSSMVQAGDALVIRREAQPEPACRRDLRVLSEDESFYVFDKPARLPMHASARFYFNTVTRILSETYPGQELQIAHRLDRETSGCLVVGRGRDASAALKMSFERRAVEKTYLALVHGEPEFADGHVIDAPMRLAGRNEGISIRMVVAADGAPAGTRVRVVERGPGCALVECKPVTGRQHQIRLHLAHVGFPIVGDKLYGHGDEAFKRFCRLEDEGTPDADLEREFGLVRHGLHAAGITFPHPRTGEPVTATAPLPDDVRSYLLRGGALRQ